MITIQLSGKQRLFDHPLESTNKKTVHPRTGHEGPEGKQRYRSALCLTSALDGVGWSTPHLGHFTPGKDPIPPV